MDQNCQFYSSKKVIKILLSLSLFSLLISYSSLLSFLISTFSMRILCFFTDRNYIFLLCNGILAFIIKSSGLIQISPPNTDFKDDNFKKVNGFSTIANVSMIKTVETGASIKTEKAPKRENSLLANQDSKNHVTMISSTEDQDQEEDQFLSIEEDDDQEEDRFLRIEEDEDQEEDWFLGIKKDEDQEENGFVCINEDEDQEEGLFLGIKKDEDQEENEFVCINKDEDEDQEEDGFLCINEDEDQEEERFVNVEEEGIGLLSVEELNKKCDDFIKKMREGIKTEAQQFIIVRC